MPKSCLSIKQIDDINSYSTPQAPRKLPKAITKALQGHPKATHKRGQMADGRWQDPANPSLVAAGFVDADEALEHEQPHRRDHRAQADEQP